jgi:transcriptional regulator with XRE-family HTH domain
VAPRPSETVGKQVARARDRRGWSQQKFADRLKELDPDTTLNRAAVAKIESGVRGVTLDEVVFLAVALSVPPVALMLPIGTEEWVLLSPSTEVDIFRALDWFCAEAPLGDEDGWLEGVQPVELFRELRNKLDDIASAQAVAAQTEVEGWPGVEVDDLEEFLSLVRGRVDPAIKALHTALRTVKAAGLRLPPVHVEYVDRMEVLGLDVTWLRRGYEQGED